MSKLTLTRSILMYWLHMGFARRRRYRGVAQHVAWLARAPVCKPIPDTIAWLSAQAILLLRSHDTELIAADGRRVEAFHLNDAGAHAECHPLGRVELHVAAAV